MTALLPVLLLSTLLAAQEEPRAPGGVVLDILSEDGLLEVAGTIDDQEASLKKKWSATWPCEHNGETGYRCADRGKVRISRCGEWSYLPPFPVEQGEAVRCDTYLPTYGWAPVDQVRGGAELLRSYLEKAGKGIAHCGKGTCPVVIGTNALSFRGQTVSGLAACSMDGVGIVVGPPGDCKIVALKFGDTYRLRVVRGYVPAPQLVGEPDFNLALYVNGQVQEQKIIGAIRKKLSEPPLILNAEPRASSVPAGAAGDMVIGVAKHRRSAILPAWEWVTVRVDRFAPRAKSALRWGEPEQREFRAQAEVQVTLTLMISRRNTNEYQMPNDAEYSRYLDVVRASVGLALEENCKQAEWLDARTLVCQAL